MIRDNWSAFEYSKWKLILHQSKVSNILEVIEGRRLYDDSLPISVELHLTDFCNLRCEWCIDDNVRKKKASLDKNRIFKLFDFFAANKIGVTIEGGGEPSLHQDFKEIINYGNRINLQMGLITNGVENLTDFVDKFKWIRVSVDASDPKQYIQEKGEDKFHRVMENMRQLISHRSSDTGIGVGYVITKRNMHGLVPFLARLEGIGIDYIYIRPVEEYPDLMPEKKELNAKKAELMEFCKTTRIKPLFSASESLTTDNGNMPCVAHSLSCVIRADGVVSMCEKRRHDPVILGNINQNTFAEIWNSEIRILATQKLLNCENQKGCAVCRITAFNSIFYNLTEINTKHFI